MQKRFKQKPTYLHLLILLIVATHIKLFQQGASGTLGTVVAKHLSSSQNHRSTIIKR